MFLALDVLNTFYMGEGGGGYVLYDILMFSSLFDVLYLPMSIKSFFASLTPILAFTFLIVSS